MTARDDSMDARRDELAALAIEARKVVALEQIAAKLTELTALLAEVIEPTDDARGPVETPGYVRTGVREGWLGG